jgi:transposase
VDLLGRLERGPGPSACCWGPEKGGCATEWVEALAVEGEGLGRSRGGLTSKIHLAVDGRGLPMSILVTPGQAGDNPELLPLLDQVSVAPVGSGRPRRRPWRVIADKAYSHPSTRRALRKRRISFTCPERSDQIAWRKNRGAAGGRPPAFDPEIYKRRNVVERCFNRLKQFRGLATRYAKRVAYYRAEVVIATIALWLRHSPDTP